MVLILDNAVYHHSMADDWKSLLKASKDANTASLQELDVYQRDPERGKTAVFGTGKRKIFCTSPERTYGGVVFSKLVNVPSVAGFNSSIG